MTVDSRRPLGIPQGLNLGSDPAQTSGLTVADSLRYDEVGTVVGRLGRKRLSLSFPAEGFGDPLTYQEDITHLKAPAGGTRGYAQFYDQRIVTDSVEVLSNQSFDEVFNGLARDWAIAGGFIAADEIVVYDHDIGGASGTLTQTTAQFNHPNPTGDVAYEFRYNLSVTNGTAPALTLTGFSASPIPLSNTTGSHVVQFYAAVTPGNFVISGTSAATGRIFLDAMSLKRVAEFGIQNIPERLNILYKDKAGAIYLNEDKAGEPSGIITGIPDFESNETRAKFVRYRNEVYIIDESTRPLIFAALPGFQQEYTERTKYEIVPASIRWPLPDSPRPFLSTAVAGSPVLGRGIYSFRVQFETNRGRISAPSMPSSVNIGQDDLTYVVVQYGHMLGDNALTGVTHASVYVQYVASATTAIEPDAYKFVRRLRIGERDQPTEPIDSIRFTPTDFGSQQIQSSLTQANGHMPKLRDFVIVNGIGYGIASYDVVYRELLKSGSSATRVGGAFNGTVFGDGLQKSFDQTVISAQKLNPTFLMVSEPGEPWRMERWFPIAGGSEVGIGLSTMGDVVFVHTNKGLHAFNDDPPTFKRIPSSVGTLTRDSIQEDERMIRFMGDDGVPRLFNGAIVEETATEILPLFDQEDYAGYYQKLDRSRVSGVSSAAGKRRYYLNFPTTPGGSTVSHKPATGGASNTLAIADMSKGRAMWAVDQTPYEQIVWLGRESRLSAVNDQGEFYFLEEGFADEGPVEAPSTNPAMTGAVRWFGQQGFTTRFFIVSIEADTKGQDMTLRCRVDGISDLTETFTVNTTGRRRVDFGLPGWFKGLYLDVQFSGFTTTSGRPRVYDLKVEQEVLGGL